MYSKRSGDQFGGGIFLIGLALLFMTGYWWPGLLFVIGASNIARGMAEGREWYNVSGGIGLIGLGIVFAIGFNLPLILLMIGLATLFGFNKAKCGWNEDDYDTYKHKNDEKAKNDDLYDGEALAGKAR